MMPSEPSTPLLAYATRYSRCKLTSMNRLPFAWASRPGRVVIGDIIGEGTTQEASIVGEAANLAARLQAITAPNTILLAEKTYALAGAECTALGAQALNQ